MTDMGRARRVIGGRGGTAEGMAAMGWNGRISMKVHTKDGGVVTFRAMVGDGNAYGYDFTLGVTTAPDGTLLGMPVFRFDDANATTVTFELSDLLPTAMKAAGLRSCRNADEQERMVL